MHRKRGHTESSRRKNYAEHLFKFSLIIHTVLLLLFTETSLAKLVLLPQLRLRL